MNVVWCNLLCIMLVMVELTGQACADDLPCDVVSALVRVRTTGTDIQGRPVTPPPGTGFLVGSEGEVVTAWHVVGKYYPDDDQDIKWGKREDGETDRTIKVELWNVKGSNTNSYDADLADKDPANDVAYLKLSAKRRSFPSVVCDNRRPRETALVERIGWLPKAEVYDRKEGSVGLADKHLVGDRIRIFLPSDKGHSGGPVFDKDGRVIGVVSSGLHGLAPDGETFATPIEFVTRILPDDTLCRRTAPLKNVFSECETVSRDDWTVLLRLAEIRFMKGGQSLAYRDLLVAANFGHDDLNTLFFGTPNEVGQLERFSVQARRVAIQDYREIAGALPAYNRERPEESNRMRATNLDATWKTLAKAGSQIGMVSYKNGKRVRQTGNAVSLKGNNTPRIQGIPGGVSPIRLGGKDGDVVVVLTDWVSHRRADDVDDYEETFGVLHFHQTQRAVMLALMDGVRNVDKNTVWKQLYERGGKPLEGLGTPGVFSDDHVVLFDAASLPKETMVKLGWSWATE